MTAHYRLRCSLVGHEKDVRSVAPSITPDGGIISGSRDITCRIWVPNDSNTSFTEANLMRGHSGYVSSVCAIPPSQEWPNGLIATGSNDSTINVYTLDSPAPLYKLEGHTNAVCALAAGKHGTLLSGSWDKTAKVWINQKCVLTLEGHEMAVWAVALMPDQGLILTGSADTMIRLWRAGRCIQTLEGHKECVRGLAVLSANEVVSSSNDATIRLWLISDTGTASCLMTFFGHTNYVYGITAIPPGGPGDFASVGEDRTLRVWSKLSSSSLQTLSHPATSVWCACALGNGDLVTGASDGVVRVFTTDSRRAATAEEVRAYEELVASTAIPQQIGDLKPDSLPGPEALVSEGPSDGFVKMIREGTHVTCYQWDAAEHQWKKIGEVVGSSGSTPATSGKTLYNGKEYDYVFTVDVKEGAPPLKLPYNLTEDPWWAAQKFIDDNNLSQMFLEQVAKFIQDNTSGSTMSQVAGGSTFSDPFTGSGRYIPGNDTSGVGNVADGVSAADPFTGASRYNPAINSTQSRHQDKQVAPPPSVGHQLSYTSEMTFPQKEFVTFGQANVHAIIGKLKEFGPMLTPQPGASDYQQLEELANCTLSSVSDQYHRHCELLWKLILHTPEDKVFPLLDILRLSVRSASVSEYFCSGESGTSFLTKLLTFISSGVSANQMLALRVLCNSFLNTAGRRLMEMENMCILHKCASSAASDNKNVQLALSTLLLNYAVALRSTTLLEAEAVTDALGRVLNATADFAHNLTSQLQDAEAQFRLLVCIGTIVWQNTLCAAMAQSISEISAFVKRGADSHTDKVQNCAKALKELLG